MQCGINSAQLMIYQDTPLLDLNNSFKQRNLMVTEATIKSYQITSIVVISP